MVNYKDLGLVNTREMFAKAIKGGYHYAALYRPRHAGNLEPPKVRDARLADARLAAQRLRGQAGGRAGGAFVPSGADRRGRPFSGTVFYQHH